MGRTLLQLELLHTALIGSDGSTLDADTILLDGLGTVGSNLVIGLITVFNTLFVQVSTYIHTYMPLRRYADQSILTKS